MNDSVILKTIIDLLSAVLIIVIPALATKLIGYINLKISLAKSAQDT